MKILVCGGRNYTDAERLAVELDKLGPTTIIQGGAPGADWLAQRYAREHNIPCITEKANWNRHGKAAGPIRNEAMLLHRPDLVLAATGATGTADMVRRARKAGIPVVEIT